MTTKILTVSKGVKEEYAKYYKKAKDFSVLYLGVGSNKQEKEQCRKELQINSSDLVITCIGNDVQVKGIDILLQAVASLRNRNLLPGNTKIYLVGTSGKETEKIQVLSKCLELKQYIVITGIRNDVDKLLKASDFYCQPSRYDALPLAVMEALMAELPIVASNVQGLPEVVKNRYNGFLVKPEDVEQLAEAIYSLVSDKVLRTQFSENSKKMSENFSVENSILTIYKLYDN